MDTCCYKAYHNTQNQKFIEKLFELNNHNSENKRQNLYIKMKSYIYCYVTRHTIVFDLSFVQSMSYIVLIFINPFKPNYT